MFFVYKYSDQFSLFRLSCSLHDTNATTNTALISKMLILMCLLCIKSIVAILLFYAYTFGYVVSSKSDSFTFSKSLFTA